MRFPNVEVKRENVEGKKLYYWIRDKGVIIIDYGYPDGDIHLYKFIKSINSKNLGDVLEKNLGNDEIMAGGYLEIQELSDADDLKIDLFKYKRNIDKVD
ncbi:hypothetical protein LCGC14_1857750 [marine sediment metagenome]|uniref:Uncharacterized protein n=1 Tax=marine sediment metagenome TaxID=412755 RepID=A0A0F9IMU9_9ZZZZ